MPIIDLAKLVIELTGSKSKIVKRPLPQDDPTRRQPDISLAKRELGWSPKIDLNDGLMKTIADFDERLKKGEAA
jgi:UDP-glucuronate decarboxylase